MPFLALPFCRLREESAYCKTPDRIEVETTKIRREPGCSIRSAVGRRAKGSATARPVSASAC